MLTVECCWQYWWHWFPDYYAGYAARAPDELRPKNPAQLDFNHQNKLPKKAIFLLLPSPLHSLRWNWNNILSPWSDYSKAVANTHCLANVTAQMSQSTFYPFPVMSTPNKKLIWYVVLSAFCAIWERSNWFLLRFDDVSGVWYISTSFGTLVMSTLQPRGRNQSLVQAESWYKTTF